MAYTPGLEGATPGGVPGTPGFGAYDAGGLDPMAQAGLPPRPRRPDYGGVLVKLSDGSLAVAGATDANGNTEAVPEAGGEAVLLDVVELCAVERKDWVKVVSGEYQGKIGQVVAFDGPDLVLESGDVLDTSVVRKMAVPPEGKQHGV
jgi:hypothetical protein